MSYLVGYGPRNDDRSAIELAFQLARSRPERSGACEWERGSSPNTVQLRWRMVALGGPVGWGQLAWTARLTCHLVYFLFTTRGAERRLRAGLSRRRSRLRKSSQPGLSRPC